MSTNLEKALLQLGCIKSTDTNVGIATTTFNVINPNNLGVYSLTGVTNSVTYSSAEAEKEYTNSVEWRKPDGSVSMSPSDFVVDYSKVGPVVELLMLREERNKKLAETDWIIGRDVPEKLKLKWEKYRKELRDITKQSDPKNIIWPSAPK